MTYLRTTLAAVLLATAISGCSSPPPANTTVPATANAAAAMPVETSVATPDNVPGATTDARPKLAKATSATQVTADTPITTANYAQDMSARSREYTALRDKAVTLDSLHCGDNCYLTLTEGVEGAAPAEILCTAPHCGDWQAAGGLPARLRNTGATVRFGRANQVDGSGNVMARNVRAVVAITLPGGASSGVSPRATADGVRVLDVLPLHRGVFVLDGASCASPANAAVRIWNGTGLSGSATRACRSAIVARTGTAFTTSNSCEATYDGKRSAERQVLTIADPNHFTLAGRRYARCATNSAPAELERLAR